MTAGEIGCLLHVAGRFYYVAIKLWSQDFCRVIVNEGQSATHLSLQSRIEIENA